MYDDVFRWSGGSVRIRHPDAATTFKFDKIQVTMSIQQAYTFYLVLRAVFQWLKAVAPASIIWEEE